MDYFDLTNQFNGYLSDAKIVEYEVWVSYNHPPASQPIIWLDFSEFPRVGPGGSALCTFISSFPVLSQLCITIIAPASVPLLQQRKLF